MKIFKRCLFILLDGSRPDVLGELLSAGRMPNFFDVFVKQGTFTRATSVFPSTTGPSYLPYLTGFYPGHCNVPGIRWFDRKAFKARSYVGYESYLFNHDISRDVQTLFEHVKRPMNIFSPVSRGVGFWGNRTRMMRSLYALYAHFTQNWRFVDRCIGYETRSALNDNPDFLFTAFPGVDEMTHRTDPFSEEVIKTYLQFDQELRKIIDQLEKQKMVDDTLCVLASDHGLSATHTHLDLVELMNEAGFDTFFYPKVFWPKVFKQKFDLAIMQSGNAMAHLYLKNGHGWERRNDSHECEKLIEILVRRPEISWIASQDSDGKIYVRSKEGEGWIMEEHGKILYTSRGQDPLQFKKIKMVMTPQESLELSFDQLYPDAFVQLLQLFKSERTGDVVINAAPGYDLRLHYEWPEHFSSHGSLIQEHMHVPLAFSYPIELNRKIRSVDVFPTLLKLLGLSQEKECDGLALVA